MQNVVKHSQKIVAAIAVATLLLFQAKSQDMTSGFRMLEQGQFNEAKTFFADILASDSLNPTALICYGRATGLSGNVAEAQEVFHKLLDMKPGSKETLLNLAESHLWNGNGAPATAIYEKILADNPTGFEALLGYANSKSMLKEYEEAYGIINKAIAIQPENAQAKLSRKFIRLGLADYLAAQRGQYGEALDIVNANLTDHPADQNSLMLKATIYLLKEDFASAQDIYANSIENTLDRFIGNSTATHLLKDDKAALQIAKKGMENFEIQQNPSMLLKMRLHFVSALLWNDKLKLASKYLNEFETQYPDSKEILAAKAQMLIYLSDYEAGLDHYQQFLTQNPSSFAGNLGSADANHALGMDNMAYEGAFRTLGYFPGQKDVIGFLNRLNAAHAPEVEAKITLSETSDKSYRKRYGLISSVSLTPLLKVSSGYAMEEYGDLTDESIQVNAVSFGASYRMNKRIKLNGQLELAKAHSKEFNSNFMNHIIQADIRVSKSQQIVVAQQKELQNFNKNLLAQNIAMNHFIIKNISFWKLPKIGWYSEVYHTSLSDGNTRNLFFTSVYKNITKSPMIKTGINFSAMSFTESKPVEYYSPLSFQNYEWFVGFSMDQSQSFPVSILADFATGYQISDGTEILAWRASLKVERKLNRFGMKAFAQHNSQSAVTNNGFSFSQAGFSLSYRLSERPIFYKKYSQ